MTINVQAINVSHVANLFPGDNRILLDVRETWEIELASIEVALCIPMHQVPDQLDQLPKDHEIYVLCHHGGRSMQVAQYLSRHGYAQVFNVTGGIHAWSQDVNKSLATY